jgi:hypothetical protein
MANQAPDLDVVVAVSYKHKGEDKTRWHNVGSGWSHRNGSISFNVVTAPGVRFVLVKKEAKDGERTQG